MMTRIIFIISFLFVCGDSYSQDNFRYVDASQLMMIGKAKKTDSIYQRVSVGESANMPDVIKRLAKRSAGIAILFETNSPDIRAKWKLQEEVYMSNMTPVAHSGLDLYCFRKDKWQFVNVAKPAKGTDQNQLIIRNMDSTVKQFILYLPLYNGVRELQIGVQADAILRTPAAPAVDTSKRVVVYGSSIVQGASASRPGMAYPAILQRYFNWDIINLGFSGSAKMELPLSEYLSGLHADCFVLDCIPNPSPEQIAGRSYPFIRLLRERRPSVPIIIVETVFRQNAHWDKKLQTTVRQQNAGIRKTYERLLKEGYKNIHYIESSKLIGDDHEATVDGVHLSDLGFSRIADALIPVLRNALVRGRNTSFNLLP